MLRAARSVIEVKGVFVRAGGPFLGGSGAVWFSAGNGHGGLEGSPLTTCESLFADL